MTAFEAFSRKRLLRFLGRIRRRALQGAAPSSLGRVAGALAREVGAAALDVLVPGRCRECGSPTERGWAAFCPECLGRIRWIARACPRCALPCVTPPPGSCGECASLDLRFDRAAAGGRHEGALRTAVLRFKFHRDPGVLPLLEEALLRASRSAAAEDLLSVARAIVPVPPHPLRRWLRGWDPVDELARRVAPRLLPGRSLPVLRILRKVRWTPPQVRLTMGARRRNLRGAFRARRDPAGQGVVILIDDVLTTGATASECARALKRQGATSVIVLAAARS